MSQKCPICGGQSMEHRCGVFRFDPPASISGGTIVVSDAEWRECAECGEQILSLELERVLERERTRRLGLLTPSGIKAIRERAGLNQKEMAQLIGVGDKTYTRWETGRSLQNRSNDNLIRLVDVSPEVFSQLDARRNPAREQLIQDYFTSLKTLKGENELAMAAHGGDLNTAARDDLLQRLRKIAGDRREE